MSSQVTNVNDFSARSRSLSAVRVNGVLRYECLHVGHGIGLGYDEPPNLTFASEAVVELGEVLTIEAPFYEIGSMGVTVKETVLVTSAGAQVLNRSHRGLVILD